MSKIALLKTKSFQFMFIIALAMGIGFAFAVDTDNDGMSDLYENFFQLNPTNSADALQNFDSDTLTNVVESMLWTDPWVGDTDADGFEDGADSNALSRAVIVWGHPDFTTGDEYAYTGPDWWLGAGKSGGIWTNGACWLVSSNAQGSVHMDLDRTLLTEDIVLNLLHQDASNSWVYVDLADVNGNVVATNLFGDLTGDSGEQVLRRYALPLVDYPTASRILINAHAGAESYKVWITTLYVDADADGLDADQEIQSGTLDTNPDFDADDLSDYVEVIITHTLPTDPDTDKDGYSDGDEVNVFGSDPTVPAWQEGGVPGTLQVERWNSILGNQVSDLLESDRFGGEPDERTWISMSEYAKDKGGSYGLRIRGTITVPADGDYTFFLTGDDTAELWLSETPSPYQRKQILDLAGWTGYRQLSSWRVHASEAVTLTSNQTCYVELLFKEGGGGDHVTLWWQRPGATEPEIMGSEYLRSYAQPADDQDMDGLPDALETAGGLDPLDGTGGGYLDSDGDGFSDHEEINIMGTSPTVPAWQEGGMPGTLMVERWDDIPGFQISDMLGSDRFGGVPDGVEWISISEYSENSGGACGIRIRGTITAPAAGDYSFFLTGDDTAQVWLSDTGSPYQRKQILDLAGWTGYRDLSSWRVNPSEPITLASNQVCYVEILLKEGGGTDHVTLWWTRPGETNPEIIGAEYLHSYIQPVDDQDGDALPDALETAGGLDPLDGTGGGYLDTDGDGFPDFDEINSLGSSPTQPPWRDGGIPGVLQVERWDDIPGSQISDMVESSLFGGAPDEISWISISDYFDDSNGSRGTRIRGTITAPSDGAYTFRVTGDDSAQVWLSDTGSPYQRKQILELASWTDYRDLSNAKVHASEPVMLSSNQVCYVEILLKEVGDTDHVTLWWTRPGETDPEIIGAEYLHSYVQPADDQDMDGLPDALETAGGLDPLDGTGGGHLDTDGDGFSDLEEIVDLGTPATVPMWQDGGIPGTLLVDRWNGIGGNTVAELVENPRFGGTPDERALVSVAEYAQPDTLDSGENYGIRMRGTLTAPVAGTYTFWLTGDDSAQVWLSDSQSPFTRELILDLVSYTGYRGLSSPQARSASVVLASNQTCYVEILHKEGGNLDHVTLSWIRPGTTVPEVIGAEHLNSYVQSAEDLDMDGLPDAWETANGLDPLDGTGGGFHDADGDFYNDFTEYQLGLSPVVVDADGDGLKDGDEVTITLTDPYNADTDADGILDRVVVSSINGADTFSRYSNHVNAPWTTVGDSVVAGQVSWWSEPSHVVYEITVPTAGIHQITLQASWANRLPAPADRAGMAFSIDGYPVGTLPADGTGTYTLYTPWIEAGTHLLTCNPEPPASGNYQGMSFDRVEVAAIDGVDADGNGIQDWMEPRLAQGVDSDADGVSDLAEIMLHGTNPLNADSDGDGLSDGDELAAGTDPLNEDSDGDGVSDGVEVHETMTNPLQGEFDGTVTVVATVAGSQTNNAVGAWEAEGSEIVAQRRRGFVEYTLDFPEQDLYRLNINAAHLRKIISSTPVVPIETSHLQIHVDGIYVGSYPLVSADGVYSDVRAFLPAMPAGEHTIRIFWENTSRRLSLKINQLQLQSLGGPDANGNGVKDWVETALAAMAGVDTLLESIVSPVCIEGNARYVPLMQLVDDASSFVPVAQSAGARWYANLPLAEDGTTVATATFQNGALKVPVNVEWVALNIIDHDGETLTIRKGDSVKFTALPEDPTGGQFEIEYQLDVEGEIVRSPNTRPLVYHFPEAGTYTVSGQYTHGNDVVTATIQVQVVDGTFPEESPACLVGRTREWTFEGMPANAVLEVDSSVELSELSTDQSTTNQALRTVSLKANDTNGDHIILARLYPGGPVLDAVRLGTFWIQNAVDGYFWTVARYEDSELWEIEMVTKQVPGSVDIEIKVFIAGVTLDDYSLERWITNQELDEIGEYNFRLFHPNEVETSVCHTVKVYQDGVFIGEAFSGGENNIEEE